MINENISNDVKDKLLDIQEGINKRFLKYMKDTEDLDLSNKELSERLSRIVTKQITIHIPNVKADKKDSDPDTNFVNYNKSLELKATSSKYQWQSGKFSKRFGNFLLVGWELVDKEVKLFMILTDLKKEDWKISESTNRYSTSINLKYIIENCEYEILVGDISKKQVQIHMVKQ